MASDSERSGVGGVGGVGGGGGKLTHSHSSPAGVDGSAGCGARTPPPTPKKGGKMLALRVQMLDDSVTMFQVQAKALGRVLFDQVCRQLNLLEADYFGLEYQDSNQTRYWLDLEKALNRQVGLSMVDTLLRFSVKFYTPDPSQLEEEFTRYLFCLQVKRDLSLGNLQCNDNTAALMASYIVQAECGDFVAEDYPDHTYLSTYKFVPHQDAELERRIMENHKKHVTQSPAEADLNLLETARRCELYGMKMHPAKDHEGVPLNLAVAHMGIVVFQNYTKINTFSWAKIRKISFKRKKFLIKLHPEGYGYYKDTVEFFFDGRNECKNFWKKCVEHHGFFRCAAVKRVARQKTRVLSRGSSFRYSGKTQKQMVEFVRENYVKRQTFHRSQSFRHTSSLHSSVGNVGTSISAQPLLPLGDNMAAGTPASLSCGSMTVASEEPHSPGSPAQTETADIHDFDTRDLDTPSVATSHQDTLSAGTSVTSSPQRHESHRHATDEEYASPMRGVVQQLQQQQAMQQQAAMQQMAMHHHVHHQHYQAEKPVTPRTPPPPYPGIHLANVPSPMTNHKQTNETLNGENHNSTEEVTPVTSPTRNMSDLSPSLPSPTTQRIVTEADVEVRKKKHISDKTYFIVKELLMTEHTYKKDLEVIDLWFRDEVSKEELMPEELLNLMFTLVDPIYEFHCGFVKEIEQRLNAWEGKTSTFIKPDCHRIGDVILKNANLLQLYMPYIDKHMVILERMDQAFKRNKKFEQVYKDFELQKVCYLPFSTFILKPLQRLLHYKRILERLMAYYGKDHPDFADCKNAKENLDKVATKLPDVLKSSENFVKLIELQRELVGIDNLAQSGREFIREGSLQKLSWKGYQQRMFFLFSDLLLYTNRTTVPSLQFKVHGQLPLRGVMVEETESKMGAQNCFTIYGGNRALMVSATSQEEKDKWMEELAMAVQAAKDRPDDKSQSLSFKTSPSEEALDHTEALVEQQQQRPGDKHAQQRSNTTVHVCWHRNTSVSMKDQIRATENQLSGYLLRKFKNSNGWQKLWVVFTNFCLFFYKTYQDDFPLASLPLLGYTISTPLEKDGIQKDFVFKLQFKNHVYFFRAESEYTFSRWMEVISSATQHSGRIRLFSRKESSGADIA